MRTSYTLTALLVATVVVTGVGCLPTTKTNTAPKTGSTNQPSADTAAPKTYAVGEDAPAGDVIHKVTLVEQMDVIPASATLPEWKIIAEDTPAAEGFTWLHIKGTVTNNSKESGTVTTRGIYVIDADENQFDASTDTTIYVDSDKSPIYISVQPTQTVEWDGYFTVPKDSTGLALVGNDLSFLPKAEVRIDLGL
ncbi:MAG: DUF4352 domain-containing protein [Patescibacteria group bacterium]